MGVTRQAPLVRRTFTGKRFWQSEPLVLGPLSPDAACQQSAASGVVNAVALVGYTNRAASDVLDPDATYVRADGALLGRGEDISNMRLTTGPWMTSSGAVALNLVWTGGRPSERPSATQNCDDWTTALGTAVVGESKYASAQAFTVGSTECANGATAVYCVEP